VTTPQQPPDHTRLDNGQFYQAWLKNGDILVPIGTFN
jgi:hypothetical protein